MMKTLKVFVAGIVFGILFAPHKGTKTRRKLSKVFSDYKGEAKDYLVNTADKVESKAASVKRSIKKV